MGTKPVHKILWFGQSGVTDKAQKSAKERLRIQVFCVMMLCQWVSFPKFLKAVKIEISTFLQISRTTNLATCHILEDLNLQQHSCGNFKYQKQTVLHYCQ
jgi:hypothetical protein